MNWAADLAALLARLETAQGRWNRTRADADAEACAELADQIAAVSQYPAHWQATAEQWREHQQQEDR